MKLPNCLKNLNSRKGNEKGSVTLFVLIAMLFFLMIGMMIFIINMNTETSQKRDVEKIKSEYNANTSETDLEQLYQEAKQRQIGTFMIKLIDKYGKIYNSGEWVNEKWLAEGRLPLTVQPNFPEGLKDISVTVKDDTYGGSTIITKTADLATMEIRADKDCQYTIENTLDNTNQVKINIDTTKPTIDELKGGTIWKGTEEEEITGTDAGGAVTITASDNLSGVKELKYIINNSKEAPSADAEWTTVEGATAQVTINNEKDLGVYYIHIIATDVAGNASEVVTSGPYEVKQANYKITTTTGTTYSETLKDAAEKPGAMVIKVLNTFTDEVPATIAQNVTIDTNGKTLTMAETITVAANSTATFVGTGTIQRNVADGVRGDLITNNGTVVVGVQNSETGPTLTSKDVVINNGTVTVYSGNIASQGQSGFALNAGIYSKTINVYGGNITNDSGAYGIVINLAGICNITGGRITGNKAICPQNGTLNISGSATIEGNAAIGSSASTNHNYILNISGGVIRSTSRFAINADTPETNITITGGTITGATDGISITGANSTLTIGNNSNALDRTAPVITGTTGTGINIAGATSTLNYYDGTIIGKTKGTKTFNGREVAFSVKDDTTVNFLTETEEGNITRYYRPYTRQNTETHLFETVLEKQVNVTFNPGEGATVAENNRNVLTNVEYKEKAEDATIVSLPTPEKTGYTFKGWQYGAQVPSKSGKCWVKPLANNDFVINNLKANTTYQVEYDVTLNEPIPEGYSASQTGQWGNITYQMGTSSYTYKVIGNKILYQEAGSDYEVGRKYHIIATTNTPEDLSSTVLLCYTARATNSNGDGYIINGEFSNIVFYEAEVGNRIVDNDTIVKIDQDHTLNAIWEATPYTVTLNAGDGTIDDGDDGWTRAGDNKTATKDITYDSNYGTLPTASRIGYTLKGWKINGEGDFITNETILTTASDHTLKAIWEANPYKLTKVTNSSNLIENGDFENYSLTNSPGWDDSLNGVPGNTSKAYSASNWSIGANMGVPVPEIGYHAHMRVIDGNAVFRYKTNEDYNGKTQADAPGGTSRVDGTVTTNRWLGVSQAISKTSLTAGKTYAITMDVYRVSGTTYVNTGLYHYITSNKTIDFYSGIVGLVPTKVGQWQTITKTFTLSSDYDNTKDPTLYIYGYNGAPGELYIDNVKLDEVNTSDKNYDTSYTEAELAIPTKTGYTFDGWYNNGKYDTQLTTSKIFNTENAVFNNVNNAGTNAFIYAKWTATPYTVTLNAGDGTIDAGDDGWARAGDNKTATKDITYDGTYGTLPTASRTGYEFDGWFTEATGGTQVKADTTMQTASAQTLYPHWTANNYTVIAHANGGAIASTTGWEGTGENATKSVTYDSAYGTLPTPTRTGYTFKGWNGKNLFNLEKVVHDYYIKRSNGQPVAWNNINTPWNYSDYIEIEGGKTYTFNPNSTAGNEDTAHALYDENKNFISSVPSGKQTITTPANAKYIRVSYRRSDSTNIQLEEGPTATPYEPYYISSTTPVTTANNHDINAIWEANKYTVTANANGGTIASTTGWEGTGNTATKSVTYDSQYGTLPTASRTGYTLKGWKINGEGDFITNETILTTASNHTLNAIWEANPINLADQTKTATYSTSSQTITIDGATNGTGNYVYTEVSEKNASNADTDYISIDGTTITLAASTPAGTYTYVVHARDSESGSEADGTITIIVNKAQIAIPESPAAKTYNGSVQASGITTPANTSIVDTPELVVNGDGSYGDNTNFTRWTYEANESYNGSTGSFSKGGGSNEPVTNEYFALNTDGATYTLNFDAKTENGNSTYYSMIEMYDIDKKLMKAHTYMFIRGTTTTLARDLKKGDKVIYLTNLSGWKKGATVYYQKGLIIWNYKNSKGFTYPAETYSQNVYRNLYDDGNTAVDVEAGTITLDPTRFPNGWEVEGTIPAGTAVSQCSDGNACKYMGAWNMKIPTTWTHYTGSLTGTDYSGNNVSNKFPPYAVYGKVGFLWNNNGITNTGYITNVSVTGKSITSATNVGTYSIAYDIDDKANYEWSDGTTTLKTVPWIINPYDISGANSNVSVIANQGYTGSNVTPNPTVTALSRTLTKDTDYSVNYKDNVNVGTATVYIWGKGNFSGSKSTNFIINPQVTFDANGGTGSMSPQNVTYDTDTALTANAFSKVGYSFAGWATTADGVVAYVDQANIRITENITLYAKWEANKYTVTANANGGAIASTTGWSGTGESATKQVTYDSAYGTLPEVTKTGYTFKGWNGKNLFNTANIISGKNVAVNEDGSVYATNTNTDNRSWLEASNDCWKTILPAGTYTVSFELKTQTTPVSAAFQVRNNDKNKVISQTSIYNVDNAKSTFVLTEQTEIGIMMKLYEGVANVQLEQGSTATPYEPYYITSETPVTTASNHDINAVWEANKYTVTLNAGDGTIDAGDDGWARAGDNKTATKDITYDSDYGTLPTASRTGYTFDGWYTDATNGIQITDVSIMQTASAQSLYAHWTANNYTIHFDANGGTGEMADLPMTYGTPANLTANAFSRTGYKFVKWTSNADGTGNEYIDGQTVNNLTEINNDTVNLFAQWEERPFVVTFNPNGGIVTPESKEITYNSTYGDLPSGDNIKRLGYTFAGWYKEAELTNEVTSETTYDITEDSTLYAKWTPHVYTVTFNKNGGTGTMSDQSFTYGQTQNLRANTFTRNGYTFAGWARAENGTIEFTNEQSISNLTPENGGTITLYAVWNDVTRPSWSVRLLDIINK